MLVGGMLLSAPAAADQIVYFINGKAITVKSVEKGDRLTILEIDGGGRIGVPTAQIDRIEELRLSPPSSPVAAPPVTPAAAQSASVPQAVGQAPPGATPQKAGETTGPGFGGQPAQSAGSTGVVPLQVSGGPAQEGTASPGAAIPRATDARLRPGMQPGASRQMTPRRDGAIGQPAAGLRRSGPRAGAFRGRPPMAAYQPNAGATERPRQDTIPAGEPPSAIPSPSPAPDVDPADAGIPPEETESAPAAGASAEEDPDAQEPSAEEDSDDPPEER